MTKTKIDVNTIPRCGQCRAKKKEINALGIVPKVLRRLNEGARAQLQIGPETPLPENRRYFICPDCGALSMDFPKVLTAEALPKEGEGLMELVKDEVKDGNESRDTVSNNEQVIIEIKDESKHLSQG